MVFDKAVVKFISVCVLLAEETKRYARLPGQTQ